MQVIQRRAIFAKSPPLSFVATSMLSSNKNLFFFVLRWSLYSSGLFTVLSRTKLSTRSGRRADYCYFILSAGRNRVSGYGLTWSLQNLIVVFNMGHCLVLARWKQAQLIRDVIIDLAPAKYDVFFFAGLLFSFSLNFNRSSSPVAKISGFGWSDRLDWNVEQSWSYYCKYCTCLSRVWRGWKRPRCG